MTAHHDGMGIPGLECFVDTGVVQLCYRVDGPADAEPMLLLGGLAMQLTSWPAELVSGLVARGYCVIRYDHRDSGRSSMFDADGLPDLLRALRGDASRLCYSLQDLADDAIALLDALEIDRAHLFGVSMGAMVGQIAAIGRGSRVRSLCSALGSTGARGVGKTSNEALGVLVRPAAHTDEEAVEQWITAWRVTRSSGFSYDEVAERRRARAAYDRAHHPAGSARQLAAVLAAPDRSSELAQLRVPVLVLHGNSDQLINVSGARATADAIPDARLLVIEGMGHDLPPALVERILDAVDDNAQRDIGW